MCLTEETVLLRSVLLAKPEQSGKTFVMIKNIKKSFEEEVEGVNSVNFIFCDNSLLLTKQTKTRVSHEVRLPDIDEPYIEFSSRKDDKTINNLYQLSFKICNGTRNVICCTNSKRVLDIDEIINHLNVHIKAEFKFTIWLDEADKYLSFIENKFIPIMKQHQNVKLYMLTATPQPIFNKYKEVPTLALENTTLPNYHGWNDNNVVIKENETTTTIGYARQIIDFMKYNNQLAPGSKGYIPADYKKETHFAMRDMLLQKDIAVFVVNGDGIELSIPHGVTKTIQKTKELNEHIQELYNDTSDGYNLKDYICVITGNLCVGRGITIQQPNFMFTFGILSNTSNKQEVSQNAGRLKGNMKNWLGYCPPIVYTTKKFDKIASEYEEQSREIATLAFSKEGEDKTAIITKGEVKNVIIDKDWDLIQDEFSSLLELNNFRKKNGLPRYSSSKFKEEDDGFIKSSTTKNKKILHYDIVKQELKSWGKTSTFDIGKNKNKKKHSRVFVTYKDLKDKNSICYILRIIKNIKTE